MEPFLNKHEEKHFSTQTAREVFKALRNYVESKNKKKLDIKAFIDTIDEHLQAFVEELYLWQDGEDFEELKLLGELEAVSKRLERKFVKRTIEALRKELSLAEKQGDSAKVKELALRIKEYSKKII
jgi:hypothetical protein